jgi:hypothetical protein
MITNMIFFAIKVWASIIGVVGVSVILLLWIDAITFPLPLKKLKKDTSKC